MKINKSRIKQLVEIYGTPMYLYDKQQLEINLNDYYKHFKSDLFDTQVLYASKAFSVKKMYQLVNKAKLGVDVVSYGELVTALNSGVDAKDIYFHGNNKSIKEIRFCFERGVHCFVADNLDELYDIDKLCLELHLECNVMLRMNVGVEAHTHKYIVTSHIDSKFGILIGSETYYEAMDFIKNKAHIKLLGFHSHIGSQIFDMQAFYAAIDKLVDLLKSQDETLSLNLGGGFGIKYTEEDKPLTIEEYCKLIITYTENKLKDNNLKINQLLIEPGRSIVGEAGCQLYTLGNQKQTANKRYCFVDGGMSDNIRPSLYQAKYSCDVVEKLDEPKNQVYTIAGKCCESGDILIENVSLPIIEKGDTLIVYSCGAYGYSMASNYNKLLTPCVVFEDNGEAELVCHRQTIDELLEREE